MSISLLINQLRSRIDRRSNDIASYERLIVIRKKQNHEVKGYVLKRNELAKEQALDKRLFGAVYRLNYSTLYWNKQFMEECKYSNKLRMEGLNEQ